jgi:sterol desaturase/sphingolipid hydroxylase (fatty acid hydroxylase superfamily)
MVRSLAPVAAQFKIFWGTAHQLHHSAGRIEFITAFYLHPVEVWIRTILGYLFFGFVLGADYKLLAIAGPFMRLSEGFQHSNFRTPRCWDIFS